LVSEAAGDIHIAVKPDYGGIWRPTRCFWARIDFVWSRVLNRVAHNPDTG